MRRYAPLFFISFFLVVLVIAGTTLLAGFAGKQDSENVSFIVVYTTLPVEQAAILSQEYEKITKVRVTIVPLTPSDFLAKAKNEYGTVGAADLFLTSQAILQRAQKEELLSAYNSEQTDVVPEKFCESDGYWLGVWYDPIVFAVNKDFLKTLPQAPARWADLGKKDNFRLVITDFLAADASANLLYSLVGINGEEQTLSYLGKIHPKTVQYAKFLATPPRMVGMGEADIAIAVQSETLRYVKDGFPLQIIYPEDGTAYLMTGIGLAVGSPHEAEAKRFIDWIIQDAAQNIMEQNRFYFVPTNPTTKIYKDYSSKNIVLFDYEDKLTVDQKAKLLDKWVQTVRLGTR